MGHRQPMPGQKRPLLFAHRGASAQAPENSHAAFALARDQGIPGIELDIHRCSSGELVVFHDDTTSRTAPGTDLRLIDTPWSRLSNLDIGSWKGSQWSQERPMLLAEVLEEFGTSFYYDIEIKARTTEDRGCEAALAGLLADFRLDAASVLVSSFNPISLRRFRVLAPSIPTAIIYCISDELPWYLRGGLGASIGQTDVLKPEHVLVNRWLYRTRGQWGGRAILPWTVDDGQTAQRMLDTGCVGVISNQVTELAIGTDRGDTHE